jgi:ABC-type amino acid transport substrate-binding protein
MSCIGTIAAVVTGLTLASGAPVIVATDAPFAPYFEVDAEGNLTGYERDLMDQVCVRAMLQCDYVDTTFDQLIPGVMSGEYDVALGGMSITDERRNLVDFTTAYNTSGDTEWYIGRPGAPAPDAATTAVQAGTIYEDFLRAKKSDYLAFPTEAEALAALQDGRADLAFGPFETNADVADLIEANGYDYLYSDLIPDDGIAMAVCKGNRDLLDTLNRALDAMRADGTLDDLETRWFN